MKLLNILALCCWFLTGRPYQLAFGDAPADLESPVLVDRWGVEHDWSADLTVYPDGAVAHVVVFLDVNCPVVTRLGPTFNELSTRFAADRIQFIGVYSNEGVTRMDMASHKQKLDLVFPVFLDVDGRLARLLKARATPEAFLLDADLKTRYRGMINDAGWKKTPGAVATNYLADACTALLRGAPMPANTRAQGCELQLPPSRRVLPAKLLTYHDDVAPVLRERCVACHYTGGIGPFPLDDFESVRREATTIRREVEYQRMPPWHADTKRGKPIHDVQALTDVERRAIVGWIDQGLERRRQGEIEWLVAGNPPVQPLPPLEHPQPGRFQIGNGAPDYVVGMSRPFVVRSTDLFDYQYFWIPADFAEDRYIQELEVMPGDRRVVHHMQVFLVDKRSRPRDISGPLSGGLMMLKINGMNGHGSLRIGSYTPGDQYSARRFADDEGIYFPAGYDLVLEVHYTPIDEDVADQSQVGIVWRKNPTPPSSLIGDKLFIHPRSIEVPPHDAHVFTELLPYFKDEVWLVDVRPHMHLRGADAEVFAVYPDGREELLTAVPAFDFNWQRRYCFEQPVRLPAGSSLRMTAHWDNSRINPHNPDAGAVVLFGEKSNDEMSNLGVTYHLVAPAETESPQNQTARKPQPGAAK